MDGGTALLVNLIIGAASFVTSLAGFGYALVATPFMVLLFSPQVGVPVVLLSGIPLTGLLVWESFRWMSFPRIGRWLAGGVLGIPFGAYGLAQVDEGIMRAAIGAITLAAAVTLWLKPARPLRRERLGAGLVGFASGILGGASGMSGPPVILFGLNQGWNYRELRANLIGYFTFLHLVVLIFFRNFGILGTDTMLLGAAALPGIFIGYIGGIHLKERVSQRHFRILAFTLVCLGGVLALIMD